MKKFFFIYAVAIFLTITSCKTVSKKIDVVAEEEKKKFFIIQLFVEYTKNYKQKYNF